MIRRHGKAEKIAHEILGTPINMPKKKYRGTVSKDDLETENQQRQQTALAGILNQLPGNQYGT